MRVYIAGPMTGYKDHNYPMFHAVAQRLRDAGYQVANPAEFYNLEEAEGAPREDLLREGITALMDCEAICLLPGWESSRGARLEATVAAETGLLLFSLTTLGFIVLSRTTTLASLSALATGIPQPSMN